jgi:hypothetical protein
MMLIIGPLKLDLGGLGQVLHLLRFGYFIKCLLIKMKILITGTRKTNDVSFIFDKLNSEVKKDDIIIHGGAPGVDSIAEAWCKSNNVKSIIIRPIFESKKEYYLYRNVEMIVMSEKVIAFPSDESRGTYFTITYARKRGKDVKVFKMDCI